MNCLIKGKGNKMKKIVGIILFACAFTIGLTTSTEKESVAGIGSCWEIKPLCMSGHHLCICGQMNNCMWVCAAN